MRPVTLLETPWSAEVLDTTQASTLCPVEYRAMQELLQSQPPLQEFIQREAFRAVQDLLQTEQQAARVAASLTVQAAQVAVGFQRLSLTPVTTDLQSMRDATGALIEQATAAHARAALLTDTAWFQTMLSSRAEENERLQQELRSFFRLIALCWEEANQRLQRLAASLQTMIERVHEALERLQRLADALNPVIDITELMHAHCPLDTESRPMSQPGINWDKALTRLTAHMRPRLRNPQAARVLRQRAAAWHTTPQALLRTELFPKALLLVAGEAAKPQRMRVGRRWVVDKHRKMLVVSPALAPVPLGAFVRWFVSQGYAAATATLLDEAYPRPTTQPVPLLLREEDALERLAVPKSPGANESAMLTALLHEAEVDPSDQLHRLLAGAFPRARELILLRQQGLSCNDAARVMGISRNTVYVLLHRERKKAGRR